MNNVFSRFFSIICILLLATAGTAMAASKKATRAKTSASQSHTRKTSKQTKKHGKKRVRRASWRSRGQRNMDGERVREIQGALIRAHYLTGEPTGVWDTRSQEAMRRYQSDNGWQTKVLPDSRALIKLGLGPDHSKVINPNTAATSPYLPSGGVAATMGSAVVPPTTPLPLHDER